MKGAEFLLGPFLFVLFGLGIPQGDGAVEDRFVGSCNMQLKQPHLFLRCWTNNTDNNEGVGILLVMVL